MELLANLRKNKEPLLHCSVFIELKARSLDKLKKLQSEISMELTRSKISVDRLTLRQKEGFLSVLPVGANQFGAQYERVLPASSVANLYPFNFSGKTDPHGLYIGRDKYGSNVLVDFDRRAEDKTTSNILILGNSGQGKSYLLKLILTNLRESGKTCICLDAESEYEELTRALGGCYIDFMSGEYTINPLEPKAWTDGSGEVDAATPDAFKRVTRLSQHIAFLKDFFRAYKDFTDVQIDTIEILLMKLYGLLEYAVFHSPIQFIVNLFFHGIIPFQELSMKKRDCFQPRLSVLFYNTYYSRKKSHLGHIFLVFKLWDFACFLGLFQNAVSFCFPKVPFILDCNFNLPQDLLTVFADRRAQGGHSVQGVKVEHRHKILG